MLYSYAKVKLGTHVCSNEHETGLVCSFSHSLTIEMAYSCSKDSKPFYTAAKSLNGYFDKQERPR